MKSFKNKLIIAILFIGVVFSVSCNTADNPEVVARDFLILIEKGEIDEAKKLCDKPTAELLSTFDDFSSDIHNENRETYNNFTVISSELNEAKDRAVVKLAKDGVIEPERIVLKKIKGKWKVSISK